VRTYDVAIIGGGIIGLSIGFELATKHLRVIVLDRQEPGREASWAAAGMLSPAPDSPRDLPLVPFANESLRLYPEFVEAIEQTSGKSAAYAREGALELFLGENGARVCQQRAQELERHCIAAQVVGADDARAMQPGIAESVSAALYVREEGTVEPRVLMDALLTAARNRGVEIRAGSPVSGLVHEGARCTGVMAGNDRISASQVILAAGCFSGEIAAKGSFKELAPTRPVRGQMVALRPSGRAGGLRRVLRSECGYLVPRKDGRIVAGSTSEEAGFEKHVTAAGMRKILEASLEMCPELASTEVIETWAGLRPGTPDDLPILGQTEIDGLWIATGHYRNGILLAAATAKVFGAWITGAAPSLDVDRFSPLRFGRRETSVQTAG
jgi:glycine oxidase